MFPPDAHKEHPVPERLVKQHRHYWEDAEHLLQVAREYETRAGAAEDDGRGRYYDYWKFRLARMSFIARMMAIEALLNNALEVYGIDEKYGRLPAMAGDFLRRDKFPKIVRKRRGHPFQTPLKWKLYFAPYLCREDSQPQRDRFFRFDGGVYAQFTELIVVRNEFLHARFLANTNAPSPDTPASSAQPKALEEMVFDRHQDRLGEMLGGAAGPICFHLAAAEICRRIISDTIRQLDEFLDGRIFAPRFWEAPEIVTR